MVDTVNAVSWSYSSSRATAALNVILAERLSSRRHAKAVRGSLYSSVLFKKNVSLSQTLLRPQPFDLFGSAVTAAKEGIVSER